MELDAAIGVLSRLRDGEHPTGDGSLPPDSPSQHPTVVRALYTVLGALASRPAGRNGSVARPANHCKPWAPEHDERLLAGFDAGESARVLARDLERTVGSVQARLVVLGRVEPGPWDRLRGITPAVPEAAAAAESAAGG